MKLIKHPHQSFSCSLVFDMEDGNRTDAASTSKSHAGSLHLQSKRFVEVLNKYDFLPRAQALRLILVHIFSRSAPKNEDAYEIAIPYEENNFEQQGFFNQSDQNFDGE